MNLNEDDRKYQVVMNQEEQYSIWPAGMEIPHGWTAVGEPGKKEACLLYISEVWTDMRPKSLRAQMNAAARS